MNNTWCVFTYQWSRTVGWPAGQPLRWLSLQHISSCSTWTASLAWRLSGKRCFWVAGEGVENTLFPRSEGNQGRSCWTEGWSLMTSWTRSAWRQKGREKVILQVDNQTLILAGVLVALQEGKCGVDTPIYCPIRVTYVQASGQFLFLMNTSCHMGLNILELIVSPVSLVPVQGLFLTSTCSAVLFFSSSIPLLCLCSPHSSHLCSQWLWRCWGSVLLP